MGDDFRSSQETIQTLGERTQELERIVTTTRDVQNTLCNQVEQLSKQIREFTSHNNLDLGPQLCKTLNTQEWGALYAEARRDIEECHQRLDEFILDAVVKQGKFDSPDEVNDTNIWPSTSPVEAASLHARWIGETSNTSSKQPAS